MTYIREVKPYENCNFFTNVLKELINMGFSVEENGFIIVYNAKHLKSFNKKIGVDKKGKDIFMLYFYFEIENLNQDQIEILDKILGL